MKNLEILGVQEMNTIEMGNQNGGSNIIGDCTKLPEAIAIPVINWAKRIFNW